MPHSAGATSHSSSTLQGKKPCRWSKNRQVLVHLPLGELDAVLVPLLPLQLDVAVEDVRPERRPHELRLRQLRDRLAERLRQGDDPAVRTLLGRQAVEV